MVSMVVWQAAVQMKGMSFFVKEEIGDTIELNMGINFL